MDEKTVQVLRREDFDTVLADIQARIDAGKPKMESFATLTDIEKALEGLKPVKVEATVDKKPAEAELVDAALEESGVLSNVTSMKVWNIPVGQALVGGFVAVFASELIDGFMAAQGVMTRGVVKLIGAGAAVGWGKGLLGDTGSKAVALLLAFDGIRDIIPIDQWAKGFANQATGMVTQRGLAGLKDTNAVDLAAQVARDYQEGGFYPSIARRAG